jgi:hypothetical protein
MRGAACLGLFVASSCPLRADILTNNIWPNPTVETSTNTTGVPDFWNLGGNNTNFDLWATDYSLSPNHSLCVSDTSTNAYGAWYSDYFPIQANSYYQLQFYFKYQISQGTMYFYAAYYSNSVALSSVVYMANGTNTGTWQQVVDILHTPPGANYVQLNLQSAGNQTELGRIWVDDISLAPCSSAPGIRRVALMPNLPSPFQMRNWKAVATNFDNFAFNYKLTGLYLPLIKPNNLNPNFVLPWFALPSYVGVTNYTEPEAVTAMGAILGATLVGIDKSNQNGTNWVLMMKQFYNHTDGLNVLFNNSGGTLSDFWYQLVPTMLFGALIDRYPATAKIQTIYASGGGSASMTNIFSTVANKWYGACQAMGGTATNPPNFNWTGYSFGTNGPYTNGLYIEPESAGGIAWLEYMAWRCFGQTNAAFLQAADWGLQFMQNSQSNVLYDCLLPYGVLAAARMNAELGRSYDLDRFMNWCFDGDSYANPGWGIASANWGGEDVSGIADSIYSQYAFAMETFQWAGALTPVARYNQTYAHDIGKWQLNLANSMRLFYAGYQPLSNQSSTNWLSGTNDFISYEGLRQYWNGANLYACGDALRSGWAGTDYGVYGAAYAGFLGAIVDSTTDPAVLQLDLLATDFFKDAAYPTYLYYNPYSSNCVFGVNYGSGTNDLLDVVSERFLATNVTGATTLSLPPDGAAVVVVVPSAAAVGTQGNRMYANGVIVDYQYAGLDTDGDGLPDWWETRYYGGATNAAASALARNGRTNLECYQLGLNPLDPNANLSLAVHLQSGTGYPQLSWPTIGGKTYFVESASVPLPASFQTVAQLTETNVAVGMPGSASWSDSVSAHTNASSRFYRLCVLP